MTSLVRKLMMFGVLELEDELSSSLLLLQFHLVGVEHALHEVSHPDLFPAHAHVLLHSCQYDAANQINGIDSNSKLQVLYSIKFLTGHFCRGRWISTLSWELPRDGAESNVSSFVFCVIERSEMSLRRLPEDIQAAVCNKGIKVANCLYGLFWVPGDWCVYLSYECVCKSHTHTILQVLVGSLRVGNPLSSNAFCSTYTKDRFTADISASNNNTFTHCASTTNNGTTTSSSFQPGTTTSFSSQPGTTTSSSSQPGSSNVGPIVGGVVGGIAAVVLAAVAFFFWRRQRRMRGPQPLDLSKEYEGVPSSYTDGGHPDMDIIVTPFSGTIASGKPYIPFVPPAASRASTDAR